MQSANALKLAALVALGLGAVWLVRKAGAAAGKAVDAVGDAVWAVSPTNNDNVIYQTANWATGGTPDRPIGVRIYEFFNPDPLAPPKAKADHSDPTKPTVNPDGFDFSQLSG
jgi:hypothetical protein